MRQIPKLILMVVSSLLLLSGHVYGHTSLLADDNYKGDGYTYSKGAFTFTSDYVWANFDVTTDGWILGSHLVDKSDIQEIGYYKINSTNLLGKNKTSDTIALWQQDSKGNVTTNNSTIFEQNDKIGIYMKINDTYYSTTNTNINGVKEGWTNVDPDQEHFGLYTGKDLTGHYEYFLEGVLTSRSGESSEDFMQRVNKEIETRNYDLQVLTSDGKPLPLSGTPLPGLLVTLAIGGAAMTGYRKLAGKRIRATK